MNAKKVRKAPEPDDDILWGVAAIAAEVNRPPTTVIRLLRRGVLPGRKLGGMWVSSRSALRRTLAGKGKGRVHTITIAAE